MSIEIVPAKEVPTIAKQKLVIDGIEVGDLEPFIRPNGTLWWHAIIRLGNREPYLLLGHALIQGHGTSHADAIRDAVESAQKACARTTELLEAFAKRIGLPPAAETLKK